MNPLYENPEFYSHIPTYTLYQAMLGVGGLYLFEEEVYLLTSDPSSPLPCGCPGMELIKVVDKEGNKIYEKQPHAHARPKFEKHISLQGGAYQNFWDKFYLKYSYLKPQPLNY